MKYCNRAKYYRLQIKSEKDVPLMDCWLISSEQHFIPAILTTRAKKNFVIPLG